MPTYHNTENAVLVLFKPGTEFEYNGKRYTVSIAGKPQASGSGEGKTDCYIGCSDGLEFKISIKQDNADFFENKINAQRAETLFGNDWHSLLRDAVSRLARSFAQRQLIYYEGNGRIEAGSITLGWRCDILNKPSGELSAPLTADLRVKEEIISGANLPPDKRDSYVNGRRISNSGVANLLWEQRGTFPSSADELLCQCLPIGEAARTLPDMYIAAKAVNYRLIPAKYDGDRPLLVAVRWKAWNNTLTPELILDEPLLHGATEMANTLKETLGELGISTIEDLRRCCS